MVSGSRVFCRVIEFSVNKNIILRSKVWSLVYLLFCEIVDTKIAKNIRICRLQLYAVFAHKESGQCNLTNMSQEDVSAVFGQGSFQRKRNTVLHRFVRIVISYQACRHSKLGISSSLHQCSPVQETANESNEMQDS